MWMKSLSRSKIATISIPKYDGVFSSQDQRADSVIGSGGFTYLFGGQ
jgi:hypothetical protein